jgi:hypothetical protein
MADRNVRLVKSNGKKPGLKAFAKTSSTALDENSLVEITSGYVAACDDNETTVWGILRKEVAATDSDYASTTKVPVQPIHAGDEIEIDTTAEATVGVSYGISNAYTVDVSDTSNDLITCTAVISSTRMRGIVGSQWAGNAL